MSHLSNDELVLYYYGEPDAAVEIEEHLAACADCRRGYVKLQTVLGLVEHQPVPERAADYEEQVWRKLEPKLGRRRFAGWVRRLEPRRLAWGGVLAAAVAAVFLAGRAARPPAQPVPQSEQAGERVLMLAVGEHLERSELVLVELANTQTSDISFEQSTAEDLLGANRLYRQSAISTGDAKTAEILEDLERVLLEIAHTPPKVSAVQLDELRQEIQDRGILTKVKSFGSQLREQEEKQL
jgi:hypothetical protein